MVQDVELRQLAERAILENINDEAACKKILTDAFSAGLFTEEEVNATVEDVKRWNSRIIDEADKIVSPEQLEMSKKLLVALGPFPSLMLIALIKQFPERSIGDGWMLPDQKALEKALQIDSATYVSILNKLRDECLLEKKVDKRLKKLIVSLDFYEIDALCNTPVAEV